MQCSAVMLCDCQERLQHAVTVEWQAGGRRGAAVVAHAPAATAQRHAGSGAWQHVRTHPPPCCFALPPTPRARAQKLPTCSFAFLTQGLRPTANRRFLLASIPTAPPLRHPRSQASGGPHVLRCALTPRPRLHVRGRCPLTSPQMAEPSRPATLNRAAWRTHWPKGAAGLRPHTPPHTLRRLLTSPDCGNQPARAQPAALASLPPPFVF